MNEDTFDLLVDATGRLERAIRARNCPAIVAIQGQRALVLSDYDYLRDEPAAKAFEDRAAAQARRIHAVRWVFAVPQVWVVTPGEIHTRAVSNHPLRPGEAEAITWMTFDASDGVDYGRVPYTRRPNGEPVFDEPELFTVAVQADETMPGLRLLQTFTADYSDPPHQ